jgi:hypothetical protein
VKTCTKCGVEQPLDEFHRSGTRRDGHHDWCKTCTAARGKAYREANQEEVAAQKKAWYEANRERLLEYHKGRYRANREKRKAQSRAWARANPEKVSVSGKGNRLRRFGLTPERYDELLAAQDGGCAICGSTDPLQPGARFHIDHDHDCCLPNRACNNCRRGLLCSLCNKGLGHFGDDPDRLLAAAAYLLRFSARQRPRQQTPTEAPIDRLLSISEPS